MTAFEYFLVCASVPVVFVLGYVIAMETVNCRAENNIRVSYLCDGRYCSDGCTNTDCHHTEDIHHAKNFKCVEDGKWMETESETNV